MAAPHGTAAALPLGDLPLERGGCLAGAELGYATWGELAPDGSNAILLPGYFTGTTASYRPWVGPAFADPERWFVVATDLFGSGVSTVPPPNQVVTVADNVRAQRALLDHLGVRRLRLVAGWSMGTLQAYEWALRFPEMVGGLLAICGAARCSPYNAAFLGGLRAVLSDGGRDRLRAFGEVYAGWAYSPEYFEEAGHAAVADILTAWGDDHAGMDTDGLLAMLQTWQHADPSTGRGGDLQQVLGTISCPAIVVAGSTDRYFSLAQNVAEAAAVPGAQLRVLGSELGHIAGRPGVRDPESAVIAQAFADLLEAPEGAVGIGVDQLAGWIGFLRVFGLNPHFAKTPPAVRNYLFASPSAP